MIMKKIKILIMIVLITLPVYAQNVAGVCATKDFLDNKYFAE